MKSRTGQLRQDNQDKSVWTGQPDKSIRTGQSGQDSQDRIAAVGRSGEDDWDRSLWTEQRGHNVQSMTVKDMSARPWYPGQDSRDRTDRQENRNMTARSKDRTAVTGELGTRMLGQDSRDRTAGTRQLERRDRKGSPRPKETTGALSPA
jgi:hypothetical protein